MPDRPLEEYLWKRDFDRTPVDDVLRSWAVPKGPGRRPDALGEPASATDA